MGTVKSRQAAVGSDFGMAPAPRARANVGAIFSALAGHGSNTVLAPVLIDATARSLSDT